MQNGFCSYYQSLALKELGFRGGCVAWYNINGAFIYKSLDSDEGVTVMEIRRHEVLVDDTPAPETHHVFTWARIVHGLYHTIFVDDDKTFGFNVSYFTVDGRCDTATSRGHKIYEQAELICIDKIIEKIRNKPL